MKADMFLKLAPIKGDSVDAKHKDEIELRKKVDAASPALHAHCCCGTAFAEATIVKRKSGLVPLEYFKLTLKEVFISSVELEIGGGNDSDDEVIKLRFTEFVEEFVPQKEDGSASGSLKHGYNAVKCIKI